MKTKLFKTILNQLTIGCVFFGTLVGAGFASGKETWVYFANFGVIGYVSILLACVLFFFCGIMFLKFGRKFQISTVQDMNKVLFKKFAIVAEIIMVFCNLILLSSMFAGANSLFSMIVSSTSFRIASVLTAVFALLVVWFGFGGLTKANIVVVPLLLSVLLVCFGVNWGTLDACVVDRNFDLFNIVKCLIYCVLFVSSNMFFAGFVFSKLGAKFSKTEIVGGCALGCFLLFVSLVLMSIVLFLNPNTYQKDMPIVYIASKLNPAFSVFTLVVVWVGLLSTAIALLYTISNWLKTYVGNIYFSSILTTAVAMLLSGVGFSGFISYVYPFLGVIGIFYIFCVARFCKRNKTNDKKLKSAFCNSGKQKPFKQTME